MLKEKEPMNVEALLAKATKPNQDAMLLHPFYRGKVETTLKCCVRDFQDFAIWYTPGVYQIAKSWKSRTQHFSVVSTLPR